jgi:hypothetical protein
MPVFAYIGLYSYSGPILLSTTSNPLHHARHTPIAIARSPGAQILLLVEMVSGLRHPVHEYLLPVQLDP